MKIEKISENKIRCTLTREDLESRNIQLSELAYGSEKAKELFRDMMWQAQQEFGFEANDAPLMIEAIPMKSERIVLLITKVDNPEELDARFSKFTGAISPDSEEAAGHAGDILDLFTKEHKKPQVKDPKPQVLHDITMLYAFENLDILSELAQALDGFYHGENTVYKDSRDKKYYLFVKKSAHTPGDFNKVCNIISEYGRQVTSLPATEAFYEEHFNLLISKNALQTLASL